MAESRASAAPGRKVLARLFKRSIIVVLLLSAITYGVDYALLHYRIATNRAPFGTVTVRPYYAVPRKDHKTEFLFEDPQDQTCVHSLFPHAGDSPCWYLSKHPEKRIDI